MALQIRPFFLKKLELLYEKDVYHLLFHLDALLGEAILTFGENEGYLSCSEGVFAYEFENERLIVKTFINSGLLSDDQIKQFYGLELKMLGLSIQMLLVQAVHSMHHPNYH